MGIGGAEPRTASKRQEHDCEPNETGHRQTQVLREQIAMLPEWLLVQIHSGHEKQDEK